MKRNKTKERIYLRTFAALFATYLVLMTGFTTFLIAQEKKVKGLEFKGFASQVGQAIEEVLQGHLDEENQITDLGKVKRKLVTKSFLLNSQGTEVAIYTDDYNLLFNTRNNWLCSFTAYREGNTYYTEYGYLDSSAWFGEEERAELENYLSADPQAKKAGDLAGYTVSVQGFWLDDEMIIPKEVTVVPMYAQTFDENGNLTSSSSNENQRGKKVYTSNYQNTKNLPYYEHGGIQSLRNPLLGQEKQEELRDLVLDQERLKVAIKKPWELKVERISGLTYRYYLVQPYQNTIRLVDENNYSEFWTAFAWEVNFWEKSATTLIFVWLSCLIAFLMVAFILSTQTYQTYKKREELEQLRQETTYALAHDLKTPLSIISGYAQNLLENVHTEKRDHYAGGIQTNVNRMDKIIREMLELSRLESDLRPAKLEDVSLAEVGREILRRYEQVCAEQSINTYLEGDAPLKADQTLIARVLDNFFVNALHNTRSGGTIGIRITVDSLEIYNSGSQIPVDKLKDIWQPYIKADASRGNTKGTGLGLAIAGRILELYGFSYGAKNCADGVIFWFKFSG